MPFETQEPIRIPIQWGPDAQIRAEGTLVFDRQSARWSMETPCELPGGARLYLTLDLDRWGVPEGTRAIVRAVAAHPGGGAVHSHTVEFEFSSLDVGAVVSRVVVPLPEPGDGEESSADDVLTMDDEDVSELDAAARRIFETIPPDARVRRDASALESSLTPAPRTLPSQWRRILRASVIAAVVVVGFLAIAYLVTWPRIR